MSQSRQWNNRLARHPFGVLGLICLGFSLIYTQSNPFDTNSIFGFTPVTPLVAGAAGLLLCVAVRQRVQKLLLCLGATLAALGGFLLSLFLPDPNVAVLSIGAILLGLLAVYFYGSGGLTPQRVLILLMAAGFLLRLFYILYTPVTARQHDVWQFSYKPFAGFEDYRHAEYIEYIATHLTLPEVDPTAVGLSQLYHPPLHHLLCGLWLRLQWELGVPYATSYENLQLLTLFYSSATMVLTYRLLGALGISQKSATVGVALVAFHPTLILMSGSVNNDMLSLTLGLWAVERAVRWYRNPTFCNILWVALGVGLAMMTKLSAGLIAPAIALLFVWRWVTAYGTPRFIKLTGQFALFGVVCLPLALWWQVKNALLYRLPLTFVPALSQNSGQYVGDTPFLTRWLGVEKGCWNQLFVAFQQQGAAYNEYNPTLSLLKTALFGEFTLFDAHHPAYLLGMAACYALFAAQLGMIVLVVYALWKLVRRYYRSPLFWAFLLLGVTVTVSYYRFCFAYPQTCTQNFRYALPLLWCGAGALAGLFQIGTKKERLAVGILTTAFCLTAGAVYLLLGL